MPKITATVSRPTIHNLPDARGRGHDTMLRVQIHAPALVHAERTRPPLNIGIVIDRSGSMAGQKLRDAVEATTRIVNRLTASDRCTIVAFDHRAALISDSLPVTSAQRQIIEAALTHIRSGGSTNLSDGWQMAVDRLRTQLTSGLYVNRVLLLTDGQANQGIREADKLAALATLYTQEGINLSTYGLGLHYNEELLELLAQHGLGNHHFMTQSGDIDGYFQHELAEMFGVVMQQTELRIDVPHGFSAEIVGHPPHRIEKGQLVMPLGALIAQEQRTVYVRLSPSVNHATGVVEAQVQLHGSVDGSDMSAHASYTIHVHHDAAVRQLPADHRIEHEAALIDLAWVRAEASRLNVMRNYQRAREFVLEMHQRSIIYAQFDLYASLAMEMSQLRDDMTRKRSFHSKSLASRFSTKDLAVLHAQYNRLVAEHAPMSEIMEIKQLIDMLEEWLRRRQ